MFLGRVIGSVWATRRHHALDGGRLVLLQPVDGEGTVAGEPLAALDTVGSGPGDLVLYVTSYEASLPWRDRFPDLEVVGVDAGVVGIVEAVRETALDEEGPS